MTHRWIAAPLLAAVALCLSGFLDSLEATTRASVELARASEQAPDNTAAAAEEVKDLPAVADLTSQQADAFEALAAALRVSGRRVSDLDVALTDQVDGLRDVQQRIAGAKEPLGCIGQRVEELIQTSSPTPELLDAVASTVRGLVRWQDKSIRHLRSINRKLTALGAVATATDVEVPPAPTGGAEPQPGGAPAPVDC